MNIICIGRNYDEHARELGNEVVRGNPVVFMKPPTALLVNDKPFYYPDFTSDLHYECELVLKICKNGRYVQPEFADSYFEQVTLGIDFTARDLQSKLKAKGHPWEIAKGFDNSAVMGQMISKSELTQENMEFKMLKNGEVVQHGFTKDLVFSFNDIICYVSKFFRLHVGDYIYTGTPKGVGPVKIGDVLEGRIVTKDGAEKRLFQTEVK